MINDLIALARPEIVAMNAYRSARSETTQGHIWLDANENKAGNELYYRYPDPQPENLITHLAALYGVATTKILLTRGSDEGIDLLVRLFCRAGQDQIMICPPTYGMYKVAATIQGAGVVEVPLLKEENFALNVGKICQVWQPSIKIIFVCSPNNPTGNLLDVSDILTLCKTLTSKSIVVLDEAYIEFSLRESLITYLDDYPNLVVLRTLSKAYGLAGLRCGVTLANSKIIELLKKIIAPYPIPKPIVNIAYKQLTDTTVSNKIDIIRYERDRLFEFLSNLFFVKKIWRSDANFLLFETSKAKKLLEICLDNGIVLRDRGSDYSLTNCIRVTIGEPSENTYLMEVLSRVEKNNFC
jgi:histidinol-phosphate aminotransferase